MNSLPAYKRSDKSVHDLMPPIIERVLQQSPGSPVEVAEMRDSIWVRWNGFNEWVLLAFCDSESSFLLDAEADSEAVIIASETFVDMSDNLVQVHSACLASDSTLPTESSPSSAA